jgi:hypothetical protein
MASIRTASLQKSPCLPTRRLCCLQWILWPGDCAGPCLLQRSPDLCSQGWQTPSQSISLSVSHSGGRKQRTEFCTGGGEPRKSSTLPASLRPFRPHPSVNYLMGARRLGKSRNSPEVGSELTVLPAVQSVPHMEGRQLHSPGSPQAWGGGFQPLQ